MDSTLRFNADTMTCGGCARTIQTALNEVPSVTPVRVVPGQPVVVSYDDEATDPAAIVAAVERAGYPTSPVAA